MGFSSQNLAAHARSAHDRVPDGRVYAFAAEEGATDESLPDTLEVDGVDWRVEWAPSELAIRELLLEAADDAGGAKVAARPLSPSES